MGIDDVDVQTLKENMALTLINGFLHVGNHYRINELLKVAHIPDRISGKEIFFVSFLGSKIRSLAE